MNLVRAELVKLGRSALPWVVGGVCLLVDVFLFAHYTLTGSDAFEPMLVPFGQLSSLFLGIFMGILNVIPAVLIGCYVGAKDYANRTAASGVHWGGRYRALASKAAATMLVLCLFVVVTGVLGLLLGLVHDTAVAHLDMIRMVEQMCIGVIAATLIGLLAMTVATVTRSVAVGNLICLIVLLGAMVLPSSVGQLIRLANPLTFLGTFAAPAFSNLSGLTNVAVSFDSDFAVGQSVVGLVVYAACCAGTLIIVTRFREYR